MLIVLDPPTSSPVTLEQAKRQCDVEHDEKNALIEDYITAASDYVGQQTELRLSPVVLEQQLERWPCAPRGTICLEAGPVRDVTGVSYIDADGAEQDVAADDWSWAPTAAGAEVRFADSWARPSLACGRVDAVRVTFAAGYNDPAASDGDARLTLPPRARQAVLMLVAHWFKFREPIRAGELVASVPLAVESLIDSLRTWRA